MVYPIDLYSYFALYLDYCLLFGRPHYQIIAKKMQIHVTNFLSLGSHTKSESQNPINLFEEDL